MQTFNELVMKPTTTEATKPLTTIGLVNHHLSKHVMVNFILFSNFTRYCAYAFTSEVVHFIIKSMLPLRPQIYNSTEYKIFYHIIKTGDSQKLRQIRTRVTLEENFGAKSVCVLSREHVPA